MQIKQTSWYFWVKYSLVVILFFLLLYLKVMSDMRVGPWLLLFLGIRFIAEPVQIYWLTKKNKFNDRLYLTKGNKLNVVVGIGVITTVIILYIVLICHLFSIGELSLQILSILTVFIVIDIGCDFFMYYHLKQKKETER